LSCESFSAGGKGSLDCYLRLDFMEECQGWVTRIPAGVFSLLGGPRLTFIFSVWSSELLNIYTMVNN